jgi:hypothetical protein
VIVQWTPHTVVAFGCEQGGDTILIHDPGDPQPKLRTKPSAAVIGRGEAQRMRIADWEKPPYLWQHRQFQMVVVEPADKEPRIDWKKVWKRNALKTLGTDDGAFQDYSGVRGMRKLAGAIRNRFGHSEDKQFRKTLLNFYGTFQIGVGFRRNASAFLAGHAAALGDESLMGAARCFRKSAHEFRKGENLLKLLRRDPEKLVEVQNETAEILLRIAGIEEKAAGLLLQVAKK